MQITDLKPDDRNPNKGNKRGRKAVIDSLTEYGAGRSILIDRDGRIIAGNKTVEAAAAAGVTDVVVIPTDGTKIVAVQRTDISLDDPRGRGLAIVDNRTAELGLSWDADAMADLTSDLDLKPYFADHELREIIGDEPADANDVDAEYRGMPDYTSSDQMGVRQIIIHFRMHEDVADFARLIGQQISDKAKYIWHPRLEREDLASQKYE